MPWNWQLPGWPNFQFNPDRIIEYDKKFLLSVGSSCAFLKQVGEERRRLFAVEVLSVEGEQSARIEGEFLDRESLQSSIRRHFGFQEPKLPKLIKEAGMAEMLCGLYDSFDQPLTHEMLWTWHRHLLQTEKENEYSGKYRDHEEPMQIVGRRLDAVRVFFEAPPSKNVHSEMSRYIQWYNDTLAIPSILSKTAIAHLYFENIHPFEDGNGRIGRALVEKCLSQSVGRPLLIAVSKVLEKRKKEYYQALEGCNKTLDASSWVEFFADAVLQAQEESTRLLNVLIEKTKLLAKFSNQFNLRQEKAVMRMFQEGPKGFQGGLSAEKYISITGASRPTATRDLTELVELGVFTKTGELRHTRYWLHIPSFEDTL